jgi:Xaa-Pro aminopeptidase
MAHAPRRFLEARRAEVRARMADLELDALLVTHLPNIFYLTNFEGTAAVVLLTPDALDFITDFRYLAAVQASLDTPTGSPSTRLVPVRGSYDETLLALLGETPATRIGFEAQRLPVSRYTWLAAGLGIADRLLGDVAAPGSSGRALVATERLIEQVRVRKDEHEIATMRTAARMLSAVTAAVVAEVRVGRTEREVAAAADWLLTRVGFERPAFDTIVASGLNAALPHARPGTRTLAAGDLIVLDFGGVSSGYCVDLSRTVNLGPAGQEAQRVHQAVLEAQAAAIAAARPGAPASAVDAAARGVLAGCGLAEAFGHATGHGLGVEIHEEPRVGPARGAGDETLAPGMVFTIEPGAYVAGWGGVRIEDDVLITPDGCEVLTDCSRELYEL